MKITKTANQTKLKISKKEWQNIGRTAGWIDARRDLWGDIPDEMVGVIAQIAAEQGVKVTNKAEAYKYALEDEEALQLIAAYVEI